MAFLRMPSGWFGFWWSFTPIFWKMLSVTLLYGSEVITSAEVRGKARRETRPAAQGPESVRRRALPAGAIRVRNGVPGPLLASQRREPRRRVCRCQSFRTCSMPVKRSLARRDSSNTQCEQLYRQTFSDPIDLLRRRAQERAARRYRACKSSRNAHDSPSLVIGCAASFENAATRAHADRLRMSWSGETMSS